MKIYAITAPERLREALCLMKSPVERRRAESFATVWSTQARKGDEKAKRMSARIEIGRSAQLFQQIGAHSTCLGALHLTRARAFVAQMNKEQTQIGRAEA